jgi:NAD(P)-dependent dehydrogenase (short-subunit alcohol dehydrogenase family)
MSGRVAIVTGGSAGIGASICRHLLDAGWGVVSMSRRATGIEHPALHSVEVAHKRLIGAAEWKRVDGMFLLN